MKKKAFYQRILFLCVVSYISLPSLLAQDIISGVETDMITFESMVGGRPDAPYYTIASRILPYEGSAINTSNFLNAIEHKGNLRGGHLLVRPPRVENPEQLGYVLLLMASRVHGQYFYALSLVFIDGLFTEDYVMYFDHNLDNRFTSEGIPFSKERLGEKVSLKQDNSAIEFFVPIEDFRASQIHKSVVQLDPVFINRGHLVQDDSQINFKRFVNILTKPSGLNTYFAVGLGGGGRHQNSVVRLDEPNFSITNKYEFRSQSLELGLSYNIQNVYISAFTSFENIQPQNGRREVMRADMGTRIDHGMTNFFPKQRLYYGGELGYDVRVNYNRFFSPHVGLTSFTYLDDGNDFNTLHENRMTLYGGVKFSFPVYSGRTLAFVSANYARHFFTHRDFILQEAGGLDPIEMGHSDIYHQQFNISMGLRHKITNYF